MTDKGEEECQKILSKKDYYDILGLTKNATDDEIRKAYKKLAIKFHPDKNKSKSAEEAFKKVNQAFSVLGDKDKKKNYDLFGTEDGMGMSSSNGSGPDINPFEMFNMFFQGTPFGNMGMGGNGTGRTQIRFNNGNVSYTVFSSGGGFPGFGGFSSFGDDDDGDDVFSQMFFGGNAPRARRKEGDGGGRRNNNQHSHTHHQQAQKEMQKNMERTMMCLQLFPLICCILFIIIPVLHVI